MTDVSIIILNYQSKLLVRQQLLCLREYPPRRSHEVIVVDNHSGDAIESMIAANFPNVKFIASERNGGYAYGNNLGLARAQGNFIVLLNPDIMLVPGFIDTLCDAIEHEPHIGIAGPKILNPDGSIQFSCVRFPDMWLPLFRRTIFSRTKKGRAWLKRYFMMTWPHDEPRDVDWLFGACLIIRRAAYEAVGPLDERFFLYLEDTDWCRRFWEAGWRVRYLSSVSVTHLHGRQSEGTPLSILFNKSVRHHLRSFVKYMIKYRGKKNPHRDSAAR